MHAWTGPCRLKSMHDSYNACMHEHSPAGSSLCTWDPHNNIWLHLVFQGLSVSWNILQMFSTSILAFFFLTFLWVFSLYFSFKYFQLLYFVQLLYHIGSPQKLQINQVGIWLLTGLNLICLITIFKACTRPSVLSFVVSKEISEKMNEVWMCGLRDFMIFPSPSFSFILSLNTAAHSVFHRDLNWYLLSM